MPTSARRAGLVGLVALAACARGPALAPIGEEPRLRIGLRAGVADVTVGGDAELLLSSDDGQPLGVVPPGEPWRAVRDGALLRLDGPTGRRTEPAQWIHAVPVTEGRFAAVDGRRYRGSLEILPASTGITVVNLVGAEAYLVSVVGSELGRRAPEEIEAAKAQAVVSRTFALRNRGLRNALGFDLYGDVRDQVYGGVDTEHPTARDAVGATAGEALVYHGTLIDAYFSSTCGYQTASVREAFRTAREQPYLRPVSDRVAGDHYYCDISPRFRWKEEWDGASLRGILRSTLIQQALVSGEATGAVREVRVAETGRSGRVVELAIALGTDKVRVPGPDVRSVLRPEPNRLLGSTAFQLHATVEGGEVTRLVAAGGGWGHGVGFCQWGAVGRARAGQSYRDIATTYFPGTSLARLY